MGDKTNLRKYQSIVGEIGVSDNERSRLRGDSLDEDWEELALEYIFYLQKNGILGDDIEEYLTLISKSQIYSPATLIRAATTSATKENYVAPSQTKKRKAPARKQPTSSSRRKRAKIPSPSPSPSIEQNSTSDDDDDDDDEDEDEDEEPTQKPVAPG